METIEEEEETARKDAPHESDDEAQDDLIFYIEAKYCTVCHIEMPLRTKHCKDCD